MRNKSHFFLQPSYDNITSIKIYHIDLSFIEYQINILPQIYSVPFYSGEKKPISNFETMAIMKHILK